MSVAHIGIPFDSKIKLQSTGQWMGDGRLLITASPHLAADWKRRLLPEQSGKVVATPRVDSWNKWLLKLAREHNDIPVPLTTLQEHQLWKRIIDAGMTGESNALTRGLAHHAAASYRVLREYHIDMRELTGAGEEAEALGHWIRAVQQELKSMGRLLAADVPQLLLPAIGVLVNSPGILLDGFDRFTPLQQSLFQALQEHGIEVATIAPDSCSGDQTTTVTLSACSDAEAEYRHLARQIASVIKADTHHPDTHHPDTHH
ncbi:MAG: hypothetical protein RQ867_04235, partial [Mariprofundaceae bacterium]|nr:hypothetical protein [Mariprofundaceae bacterium]